MTVLIACSDGHESESESDYGRKYNKVTVGEWVLFMCLGSPIESCPKENVYTEFFTSLETCESYEEEIIKFKEQKVYTKCIIKLIKEA